MTHPRPVHLPNDIFDWMIGADAPEAALMLARETSWALLDRVRSHPSTVSRVIAHIEAGGIDDIAELWASAHEHSLAGALWRLYLIRSAVTAEPEMSAVTYARGAAHSHTVDPVIAGATDPVTPTSVAEMCDEILRGAFSGDLGIALDRAWAYCRVMARGALQLADDRDGAEDADAARLTQRAYRYTQMAESLQVCARLWRDGSLE